MTEHDGGRLRRRIGAVVHAAAGRTETPAAPPSVERLEKRVAHLEALVEGLQDAVYRNATRYDKRITEIERKVDPDELARMLSADARRRGL